MDWGFGNPNKTAVLVALLLLAVWLLPLVKRWLFWVALPTFMGLGVCLFHTMSRGGLVSAMAGFGILFLHLCRVRPWSCLWGWVVVCAVTVMLVFGAAGFSRMSMRFAQSLDDRSVSNRLEIWKQAPRMIVDAPWGWGIGNSGMAYMGWYQPLENQETYRTLVNSHLTWLVELGWPMRVFYVLGWMAAIVLSCGFHLLEHKNAFLYCGVVCGLWVAFCVGATFSSVAESPCLWLLPLLGLLGVLALRYKLCLWPSKRIWISCVTVALLSFVGIAMYGYNSEAPAGLKQFNVLRSGAVCVGTQLPQTWVVVGRDADGSFCGTYRTYRGWPTHPSVGFAPSLSAVPMDIKGGTLAVIGGCRDWDLLAVRVQTCKHLLLIAPDVFPDALNLSKDVFLQVIFGEFSSHSSIISWRETGYMQTIEGVGDFFQNWPEIVFGREKQ